jgi:hypothetical protein
MLKKKGDTCRRHSFSWDNILTDKVLLRQVKKGIPIPVTGRGGPQGCETSRPPHFLENRLTDGGEVVSLLCQPPFTPRKIPRTHFC